MMFHDLFKDVATNSISEIKLSAVESYNFGSGTLQELPEAKGVRNNVSAICELSDNKYIFQSLVEIERRKSEYSRSYWEKNKHIALSILDLSQSPPLEEIYPFGLHKTETICAYRHPYPKDFECSIVELVENITRINNKKLAIMGNTPHGYQIRDRYTGDSHVVIEIWRNSKDTWTIENTIKFGPPTTRRHYYSAQGTFYYANTVNYLSNGSLIALWETETEYRVPNYDRPCYATTEMGLSKIKNGRIKSVLDYKYYHEEGGHYEQNYNFLGVTNDDTVLFTQDNFNAGNFASLSIVKWNANEKGWTSLFKGVNYPAQNLKNELVSFVIEQKKDNANKNSDNDASKEYDVDLLQVHHLNNGDFEKIAEHEIQLRRSDGCDECFESKYGKIMTAFYDGTVITFLEGRGLLYTFPGGKEYSLGSYSCVKTSRFQSAEQEQTNFRSFEFKGMLCNNSFVVSGYFSYVVSGHCSDQDHSFLGLGQWNKQPITNEQINQLLDKLRVNTSVKLLDLSTVRLTVENASNLAYTLKDNQNIETLLLNASGLTNEHMQELLPALKKNKNITTLNLDENNISGFLKSQAKFYITRNKAKKALALAESIEVPEIYRCPLTKKIMRDPVVATDGETYERAAIIGWLETNSNSPVHNIPLDRDILIPHKPTKRGMEDFLTENPSLQQKTGQGVPPEITQRVLLAIGMADSGENHWVSEDIQKLITEGPVPKQPSEEYSKAIIPSSHMRKEDLLKLIINELGEYFWLQRPIELDGGLSLFRVVAMTLENDGIEALVTILKLTKQDFQEQLEYAIDNDNVRLTRVCIDFGADIHYADAIGRKPIHCAAVSASFELVDLLLNHGALPDDKITRPYNVRTSEQPSSFGDTALLHAIRNKNEGAALAIIEYRANFEEKNSDGNTALFFALYEKQLTIAKTLISAGANFRENAPNGDTTLHAACSVGAQELALLLKARGIDPTVENSSKQRASDLARLKGFENLADLIDGITATVGLPSPSDALTGFGSSSAFFTSAPTGPITSPLTTHEAKTYALNNFKSELTSLNTKNLVFSCSINECNFTLRLNDANEKNNKSLFRGIGDSLKRHLGPAVIINKESKKDCLIIKTEDTDTAKDIKHFLKDAGLAISKPEQQKLLLH